MKNLIACVILFVLTTVSYGQEVKKSYLLIKPNIQILIEDSTFTIISKERTNVLDSDSLQYIYSVDEINKMCYIKFLSTEVNREYRIELLTYVYGIAQPISHSNKSKGNWSNRLNKCYNIIYVTYENGVIAIK